MRSTVKNTCASSLMMGASVFGLAGAAFAPTQTMAQTQAPDAGVQVSPNGPQASATTQTTAGGSSQPRTSGTSAAQLQEVVVTARRVSERLQDVPASVEAVNAAAVQQMTSLNDLSSFVSGVTFKSYGPIVTVGIRGYGNRPNIQGPQNAVGIFQDGVYIAPFLNPLDSRIDVSRIEVAKGPQSTLYGRASYTGAINIVTTDPTSAPSGYLEAGGGGSAAGGESLWHVQGVVSGPLLDTLEGRLFFIHEQRDGYTYDPTNGYRGDGYDRTAGRGRLKWQPTKGLVVRVSGTVMHDNSPNGYVQGNILAPLGNTSLFGDPAITPTFPKGSNIWEGAFGRRPIGLVDGQQGTVDIRYNTPFGELASLTDYQHSNTYVRENSEVSLPQDDDAFSITSENRYSQEFRLSGKVAKLSYLAGLYYLNTDLKSGGGSTPDANAPFALLYPGAAEYDLAHAQGLLIPTDTKTNAYAVFAQLGYNITDRLNLTLGIREGRDNIRATTSEYLEFLTGFLLPLQPRTDQSADFDSTTGSANLSYKVTHDTLVYASYSRGDAPGGFNTGSAASITYAPQTVDAYEVGLKAEGFDRRLRANVAFFDNIYHDLQTFQAVPLDGNVSQVTTNASGALGRGVDLDTTAIFSRNWRVNLQYTHQTSRINSYKIPPAPAPQVNFLGAPLVRSPEDTLDASLTYTQDIGPGEFEFTPEVSYTSSYTNDYQGLPAGSAYPGIAGVLPAGVTNSQVLALFPTPGYALVNLDATYRVGSWLVSGFVRNLLNKQYVATLATINATAHPLEVPGEPRTFEISLRKSF